MQPKADLLKRVIKLINLGWSRNKKKTLITNIRKEIGEITTDITKLED